MGRNLASERGPPAEQEVRGMDLDQAVEIVNDPSLNAYCDYVHEKVFATYGEYEFGIDQMYDEIAVAFAFVAVELALNGEGLHAVPNAGEPKEVGQDAPGQ